MVLIVEDEFLIRLLLEEAITEAGWAFVSAGSADEALSLLQSGAGRLDGLITDVRLGREGSGWEVAQRARELSGRLPVIYITGDSQADWRLRGVEGSRLLLKPFLIEGAVELLVRMAAEQASSI